MLEGASERCFQRRRAPIACGGGLLDQVGEGMLCTEIGDFCTAMTIRHHEELDGLATDVGNGRARPILTLQVVRAIRCIAGALHFCEPNPSLQASDASARL